MSKGLGRTQRAVLRALYEWEESVDHDVYPDTADVVTAVSGLTPRDEGWESARVSVSRALRKMVSWDSRFGAISATPSPAGLVVSESYRPAHGHGRPLDHHLGKAGRDWIAKDSGTLTSPDDDEGCA